LPPRLTRLLVLWVALLFTFGFGFLTYGAISEHGVTLGSLVSVFILILLGVGVIGALLHPPDR
jgi:hypothetical protein